MKKTKNLEKQSKKLVNNEIASLIRKTRLEKGITGKDLAEAVDVWPGTISKIEHNTSHSITKELLVKIFNYLDLDTDIVYNRYNELNPQSKSYYTLNISVKVKAQSPNIAYTKCISALLNKDIDVLSIEHKTEENEHVKECKW